MDVAQMLVHPGSLGPELGVFVIALTGGLFVVGTAMFVAYERRNQGLRRVGFRAMSFWIVCDVSAPFVQLTPPGRTA